MIKVQHYGQSEANRGYWDSAFARNGSENGAGAELLDRAFRLLRLDLSVERLLDVGCGAGEMLAYVSETVYASVFPYADGNYPAEMAPPRYRADLELAGVDCSRRAIGEAIRRSHHMGIAFHVMDAEGLRFRDGSFQRVLCMDALGNFWSPEKALREMARVLSPDGRLLLILPVAEPAAAIVGSIKEAKAGPNRLCAGADGWAQFVRANTGLLVTSADFQIAGFTALECLSAG